MPRPKIGPACVRTPIGRDLGRGVSRTFVRGRTVRRGCGGDSASGSGDSSVGVSAPGASAAGGDGSVAPRRAIVRSIDMLVASAAATLKVAHPSGPEAISCAASLGRSGSVRTIDARSCEPLRTMRVVTAIGFAPPDGANGSNARRWRTASRNSLSEKQPASTALYESSTMGASAAGCAAASRAGIESATVAKTRAGRMARDTSARHIRNRV